MDGLELLKTWPGWARAGAETVLASPAWRLPVRLDGGEDAVMRFGAAPLADTIDLDITLDDEPHVLSLADSPRYPDLHLLWDRRDGLPPEILLALLEKECGPVFTLLENATRCLLGVKGLASAPSADARVLEVEAPSGTFAFALDLPPGVRTSFGCLENLDTSHPSIRELTRPARVDYCSLILTEEERQAMSAGDHLLVPESFAGTQRWTVDAPADEAVHLCSPDFREISFGSFADDALPDIPEPSGFVLVCGDRTLGTCSPSRLGLARTIRIS